MPASLPTDHDERAERAARRSAVRHADRAARGRPARPSPRNPTPSTSQSAATPGLGSTWRANPMGIVGEATTARPTASAEPVTATIAPGASRAANRCSRLTPSDRSVVWSTLASTAWRASAWPTATNTASASAMAKLTSETACTRVASRISELVSDWVSTTAPSPAGTTRLTACSKAARSAPPPRNRTDRMSSKWATWSRYRS